MKPKNDELYCRRNLILLGTVSLLLLGACRQSIESGAEADLEILPVSGEVDPAREKRLFVSAPWLMAQEQAILNGEVKVVEVIGFGEKPSGRHIQGAVAIRTDEIEREPLWNLVPDDELFSILESKGLIWNRTTIFYGKDPFAVARVVWAASYAGLADARWLWSGVRGWTRAGGEVQSSFATVEPSVFGRSVPAHPEYQVSTAEIKERLEKGTAEVVSVRSRLEFNGFVSGYSYIKDKGHIAGASWGGSATGWIHRDLQKTIERAKSDLVDVSQDLSKDMVFYCGTGWRSSMAFLLARELGYESVANYDGSWLEWTQDGSNPIE
jgi:3-mercaptopyruvate sulfurtransferase SseA